MRSMIKILHILSSTPISTPLSSIRNILQVFLDYPNREAHFVIGPNGYGNFDNFISSQINPKFQNQLSYLNSTKWPNIEVGFQNVIAKFCAQSIRLQTHFGLFFLNILQVSKNIYLTFFFRNLKIKQRYCCEMNTAYVDKTQYQLSLVDFHKNDSNSHQHIQKQQVKKIYCQY
ncbi:unnamed protein product [Paramecium octaurelia]|uniref:Uncharacterized protein n=1 Tax=Paramecium octaurelia TaxID=43137 RepID=A0A8S1XS59_PAROT|nr:unnamed protein product [Paramecium octaurelia]